MVPRRLESQTTLSVTKQVHVAVPVFSMMRYVLFSQNSFLASLMQGTVASTWPKTMGPIDFGDAEETTTVDEAGGATLPPQPLPYF